MADANEILTRVLYPVVRDANESLADGQKLRESADMPLFGPGAPLDSMGLVRFLVEVEERVQGELESEIRLVSDKAMSRRNSPFRSLQTLAEYVVELMQEEGGQ
jgi:hypothetical protein